jgi:acyl-CoA thioester hydrolase
MYGADPAAEREALADARTYTLWRQDTIRFADLDVLGHVNNVAYMVYFETGRVAFLEQLGRPPRNRTEGATFVLAHIAADYLAEVTYPGQVDIGTAVRRVGTSSFHLGHGIFVGGECKAIATSIIVQVQGHPLRSVALSDEQKERVWRIEPRAGP